MCSGELRRRRADSGRLARSGLHLRPETKIESATGRWNWTKMVDDSWTGAGIGGGAIAGLACGPGAPVCITIGAFVGGAVAALGVDLFW